MGRLSVLGVGCAAGVVSAVAADPPQLLFSEASQWAGLLAVNDPPPSFVAGIAYMLAGGAAGDFNNDGWQDLFILSSGTGPDYLFINQQDGTFVDMAAAWGLTDHHMGSGAAVGDFNNDGWLDIYVTSFGLSGSPMTPGAHRLYRNNGNMTFTDVAAAAGVNWSDSVANGYSAAFGDYDLDGDLDLYVTGWLTHGVGGNRLFRNEGNETFTDVTVAAGIWEPDLHGFTPRFVDTDGDRYPEILFAADFEDSRYYANNGDGTFTEMTVASGTGLDHNGMGATIGDYDSDGNLDWYVTAIYVGDTNPSNPCGNTLYMGQGNHLFDEQAHAAGVIDGRWGWGTTTVDLEHDGDEDIVEVNGYADSDLEERWSNQCARVFVNQGSLVFTQEAETSGFLHFGQGRGIIHLDADNDGDQDFVVLSTGENFGGPGAAAFYRNDTADIGNALRLFLDTSSNSALAPNGFGTRLRVKADGMTMYRYLDGGSNYLSQSELTAHFGLAAASSADELRIEWADGSVTVLCDVAANSNLTIASPSQTTSPADINGSGAVDVFDLLASLEHWGGCGACCPQDVNGDDMVDVFDLLLILSNWSTR